MRKRGQVCDKRSQARCTIPESRNDQDEIDSKRFFCVGCMEAHDLDEGYRHHVLEHTLGGLSEKFNCLMICASCHMVIHNGTRKDRKRIWRRLYTYMGSMYGLLFLLQYPMHYGGMKKDLTEKPLTLAQIRALNESMKDQLDRELMHQIAPGVLHIGTKPYESVFPE